MGILTNIIVEFPNIPKSIFKFSKEGLSPHDKFYEIKEYNILIMNSSRQTHDSENMVLFTHNLYKNGIISLGEYFLEIYQYREFSEPSLFEGSFATILKFNNIVEKYSLIYNFIEYYNNIYSSLSEEYKEQYETRLMEVKLYKLLKFTEEDYDLTHYTNIPGVVKKIERLISYILNLTTYAGVVKNMPTYDSLSIPDDVSIGRIDDKFGILYSILKGVISADIDRPDNVSKYFVELLKFLDPIDFETIYNYNDAYINKDSNILEKNFKILVNQVKMERGI